MLKLKDYTLSNFMYVLYLKDHIAKIFHTLDRAGDARSFSLMQKTYKHIAVKIVMLPH